MMPSLVTLVCIFATKMPQFNLVMDKFALGDEGLIDPEPVIETEPSGLGGAAAADVPSVELPKVGMLGIYAHLRGWICD